MATQKIDFAAMSDADLKQELETRMGEIQSASFDHSVKGIANPMELRAMRRNIARINTEMRKRELAASSAEVLEGRSKLRARRSRQKKQA
ncbi:MAG: 50S ribosomal protein L29 [Chitinophagales bacterium]|jgi:large subunit ribosomal protein L29|nr:50S ribosomal protein L29 [Chitinophagales bacterium]